MNNEAKSAYHNILLTFMLLNRTVQYLFIFHMEKDYGQKESTYCR